MESTGGLSHLIQKLLLICGIAAPLLTLLIDRLAGRIFEGYSFTVQSMSELSASGSPTRNFVVSVTVVTTALMLAFGVGIWRTADQILLQKIVSALVIGNAVTGLIATLFFPTDIGVRPIFGSTGVLIMFLSVVCFVLAMVVGAFAYTDWVRILSIGIPVSYVLLAIWRFATDRSSPGNRSILVGAQERTMSYSFLIWVLALAIYLLLRNSKELSS